MTKQFTKEDYQKALDETPKDGRYSEAYLNEWFYLNHSVIISAITHAIEHMKRWQWQPIESAPVCEDVDLWSKYGRYVRCQHDDYGHWFIWSDEFNQYVTLSPSIKPTHWMQLPEPPQERKN